LDDRLNNPYKPERSASQAEHAEKDILFSKGLEEMAEINGLRMDQLGCPISLHLFSWAKGRHLQQTKRRRSGAW